MNGEVYIFITVLWHWVAWNVPLRNDLLTHSSQFICLLMFTSCWPLLTKFLVNTRWAYLKLI